MWRWGEEMMGRGGGGEIREWGDEEMWNCEKGRMRGCDDKEGIKERRRRGENGVCAYWLVVCVFVDGDRWSCRVEKMIIIMNDIVRVWIDVISAFEINERN